MTGGLGAPGDCGRAIMTGIVTKAEGLPALLPSCQGPAAGCPREVAEEDSGPTTTPCPSHRVTGALPGGWLFDRAVACSNAGCPTATRGVICGVLVPECTRIACTVKPPEGILWTELSRVPGGVGEGPRGVWTGVLT